MSSGTTSGVAKGQSSPNGACGLAALQTVLEEGNKDDWFGSPFIVRLLIVAGMSLALFVWIDRCRRPRPVCREQLHE
ncbi:MAG TPA: hypothetical protein VET89_06785, partial [Stellaceae bacterium]|nr:hypothetical protein [Stellaceae bacterium]